MSIVLVNKSLWATTVERIAEYTLRAELDGTPEQLIKRALDGFTADSRAWYEKLRGHGLSEFERWSAALHQARSWLQLSSLAIAINENAIGVPSVEYAIFSAFFVMHHTI